MLEKFLTLICTVAGAISVTLALPELIYYAPPMYVIMYTVGIIVGGAGIRAILKGNR